MDAVKRPHRLKYGSNLSSLVCITVRMSLLKLICHWLGNMTKSHIAIYHNHTFPLLQFHVAFPTIPSLGSFPSPPTWPDSDVVLGRNRYKAVPSGTFLKFILLFYFMLANQRKFLTMNFFLITCHFRLWIIIVIVVVFIIIYEKSLYVHSLEF